MIVRVQREAPRRWTWECHRCHLGDARNTWPDCYREARSHLAVHATFGFRVDAFFGAGERQLTEQSKSSTER